MQPGASVPLPTIALPPFALPFIALPPCALSTIALPSFALPTSALPTSALPTSALPTSALPTSALPTSALPTVALPSFALPTIALPTVVPRSMSTSENTGHRCPFPLCKKRPYSRHNSLKRHLGAVIASDYDSEHPLISPLWKSDTVQRILVNRTPLRNAPLETQRQSKNAKYYRNHRDDKLKKVKSRQERINAALKSISGTHSLVY